MSVLTTYPVNFKTNTLKFGDVNSTFIPNTKLIIITFNTILKSYMNKTGSILNFTIIRRTDNRERLHNNIHSVKNVSRLSHRMMRKNRQKQLMIKDQTEAIRKSVLKSYTR